MARTSPHHDVGATALYQAECIWEYISGTQREGRGTGDLGDEVSLLLPEVEEFLPLGFGVWGLGLGLGFGVLGLGCGVWNLVFGVEGLEFRVEG